jgi:hypothetical protein
MAKTEVFNGCNLPKEASVTGRVLHVCAALLLAPALVYADPAQQPSSSSSSSSDQSTTAPPANAPPQIPKEMSSRSDFSLTLTTLDALHKKGALTDEEYNAALRDMISAGQRAMQGPTFVVARFVTTLYGWLQGDFVHDSSRFTTDSFGGNPTLPLFNAANGAGLNGRTVFGSRGTRMGVRISSPTSKSGLRVSGNVEWDFFGNQPGVTGTAPRNVLVPTVNNTAPGVTPAIPVATENLTEVSFLTNATPRIRQAFVKLDTPIVSIWAGQTWNLTGWQAAFLPTSLQYQGLPGTLFGRDGQLRLSRTVDAGGASVEIAAAMVRPPQMDAEIPDFQYGLKLNIDGWTGVQTLGATGTTTSPASIGVSGAVRRFKFARDLTANPKFSYATGKVIAADAWIPVIPTKTRGPLSVGILAEATAGTGATDLYTGLSGGATIGQPQGLPATATPAQIFAIQNGDNGPVGWNAKNGRLDTADWRTLLVGLEISTGPVILAGNYSNTYSDNVQDFTGATWNHLSWWDANLLVDFAPGVRAGIEFARALERRTLTGTATRPSQFNATANESRIFASAFYIF